MTMPNPAQAIDSDSIRGVLLDIEGTTSSISFVHDVMFPFALHHLDDFLTEHMADADVHSACDQIAQDSGYESFAAWKNKHPETPEKQLITDEVKRLIAADAKSTGLKALQGLIWAGGFHDGALRAHIYPDVLPAIRRWVDAGREVRIYSSGSIAAQKLFFGHLDTSDDPNQLHLLSGHYDTTIGGKKETQSYENIAEDWGLAPSQILFISDIADELTAASAAGFQVLASVRPGNKPLPNDFLIASITTMDAVLA